MMKINKSLIEFEESALSKTRNVALDAIATSHMINSFESGEKEWICNCDACKYMRTNPRLVDAVARAIVKKK